MDGNVSNDLPESALITRAWLRAHDLSGHVIDNPLKSVQLTTLKNGVYKREDSILEWGDVVSSPQRNYETDLTIGGITALELRKLFPIICRSPKNEFCTYLVRSITCPSCPPYTDDSTFQKHNIGDLLGQAANPLLEQKLNQFTKILTGKHK